MYESLTSRPCTMTSTFFPYLSQALSSPSLPPRGSFSGNRYVSGCSLLRSAALATETLNVPLAGIQTEPCGSRRRQRSHSCLRRKQWEPSGESYLFAVEWGQWGFVYQASRSTIPDHIRTTTQIGRDLGTERHTEANDPVI